MIHKGSKERRSLPSTKLDRGSVFWETRPSRVYRVVLRVSDKCFDKCLPNEERERERPLMQMPDLHRMRRFSYSIADPCFPSSPAFPVQPSFYFLFKNNFSPNNFSSYLFPFSTYNIMTYKKEKKKIITTVVINPIDPFLRTRRLTLSNVARNIGDINDFLARSGGNSPAD